MTKDAISSEQNVGILSLKVETSQSFKLKIENLWKDVKWMRVRTFLAFFHLLNFLIMISATIYILNSFGGQLEAWRLPLYSYYLIMGLSGAAIAYWIAIDGTRLERYSANIEELEKKLLELEQKLKIMKPHIPEKK